MLRYFTSLLTAAVTVAAVAVAMLLSGIRNQIPSLPRYVCAQPATCIPSQGQIFPSKLKIAFSVSIDLNAISD